MKRIYLFLILAALSLAGCHEVTVGYIKTENAAYSLDSLEIFNPASLRMEITRLESMSVSEYDSLKFAMDSLREYSNEVNDEYSMRWFKEFKPLDTQLDELLQDSVHHVGEIVTLKEKIALKEAELNVLLELYQRLEDEANEVRLRLEELDPSEEKTDASTLETLKTFRLREKNHIAWTTSEIEGVDGTAPLLYSLAGVWAEGGNAEIFRAEIVVKGSGRLEMPYDFQSPPGRYHVSLIVENEGYKRTLEDVFTFIVK